MPCPARWFSSYSERKAVAQEIGCSIDKVDDLPMMLRMEALAYSKVMEKAKPALQVIARQRAEQETQQERIMQNQKR